MLRSTPEYAAAHRRELAAGATSAELAAFLIKRRAQRRERLSSLITAIWQRLPRPSAAIDDTVAADPEPST